MTDDLTSQIAEAINADHRETLQRISAAYAEGWTLLWERGATPRPTQRRSGKPSSRPPGGTDRQLRACLVDCARAISDATWHLRDHPLPTKPWRPVAFTDEDTGKVTVDLGMAWEEPVARRSCASCGAVWRDEGVTHTTGCTDPDEAVELILCDRWAPDADDLSVAVPHPNQIHGVCSRLVGNLGLLATRGVEPEPCMEAIRRARGAIKRAGLWQRPPEPERCKRRGCEGNDGKPRPLVEGDGGTCRACRKREERMRKAS